MLSILFIMAILFTAYILIIAIEYAFKTTFPMDRIALNHSYDQTGRYYTFNKELKTHGIAYDPWQNLFYLRSDAPQKNYGYHFLYDKSMASIGVINDPQKIYLNYEGKTWMLYLGKGQYGMACGAEAALYCCTINQENAPLDTLLYEVPSEEELLPIAFLLRHKKQTLFARKHVHWCLSGFRLGIYYPPQELQMLVRITIPNQKMQKAFLTAIKHYPYHKFPCVSIGKHILLCYSGNSANKTEECPEYRSKILAALQHSCQNYQMETQEFDHTIDQLTLLRFENPTLYERCLQMGKPLRGYTAYLKSATALSAPQNLR